MRYRIRKKVKYDTGGVFYYPEFKKWWWILWEWDKIVDTLQEAQEVIDGMRKNGRPKLSSTYIIKYPTEK